MTLDAPALRLKLRDFESTAGQPSRYVVAFSGGLDSTVLLHALAGQGQHLSVPIVAVHVDHGLQDDSEAWSEHCRGVALALGVDFVSRYVSVQLESGKGPEASARDGRYAALQAEMRDGDWLLSAHHREDQAETLLLNLVRGSGPMGIAGMGTVRRFGPGWLLRPLLNISRDALLQYAEREKLQWLEDPSNVDRRFDRNFLRHDVVPRLQTRWVDISARLQRSARHAAEAAELLAELAEIDLAVLGGHAERLPIQGLLSLPTARQKNVLRYALRCLGLATPTTLQLQRILTEVIPAREDAEPLVSWPGASVRRYRDGLYLLPEKLADVPESIDATSGAVGLGAGLGRLLFCPDAARGLSQPLVARGLCIRFRQGGEKIQPLGQRHTRKLKKLLQEEAVVPWMRDRLPLVYAGDELVAVADLWLAADAVSEPGVALRWQDRPALY